MNLKDRLVINYNSIKEEAATILSTIEKIKQNPLTEVLVQEQDLLPLKDRMKDPFLLVIVGEFNTGKSTFINTLLGRDVVPTNFLEETITINRISYGETSKKEAVLKDGRRIRLEDDELERDKMEEEIDEKVKAYLAKADAMIYMASVLSPLSQEEQNFLATVVKSLQFSELIVVANMADRIEEEADLLKLEALFKEKIAAFHENPYVFTISSLKECQQGRLKENFQGLEEKIQIDIILQRDIIQTERMLLEIDKLMQKIATKTNKMLYLIQKDESELQELQGRYQIMEEELPKQLEIKREAIKKYIEKFNVETKDWMIGFFNRLRSELNTMVCDTDTVILQKYASFFVVDVIQQAIHSCVEVHQRELVDKLSKELSTETLLHLDDAIQVQDVSWTVVDSATYIADLVAQQLEMDLTLVLGFRRLIGGFIRQAIIGKRQDEYLNPIMENFFQVQEEIFSQIDAIYQHMGEGIYENLEKACRLQLNENLESINETKALMQLNKESNLQIEMQSELVKYTLTNMEMRLEKFR